MTSRANISTLYSYTCCDFFLFCSNFNEILLAFFCVLKSDHRFEMAENVRIDSERHKRSFFASLHSSVSVCILVFHALFYNRFHGAKNQLEIVRFNIKQIYKVKCKQHLLLIRILVPVWKCVTENLAERSLAFNSTLNCLFQRIHSFSSLSNAIVVT